MNKQGETTGEGLTRRMGTNGMLNTLNVVREWD